jgi:hypothetical protein
MTLIVFICMYFGLFICTNLVDVMSLFFMIFSFHLLNFGKNQLVSNKNRLELVTPVFKKPTDLSVKPTAFIGKTGCISVFLIFTVPQLSPVRFCPGDLIFLAEFLTLQRSTLMASGFCSCRLVWFHPAWTWEVSWPVTDGWYIRRASGRGS